MILLTLCNCVVRIEIEHLFKLSGYYNHLHGLIFELKERMNSRQDRPVMLCVFYYTAA